MTKKRKGMGIPSKVSIIMGSDSDLPVIREAGDILSRFGVGHRMAILSAHRTPDRVRASIADGLADGVQVFIAGAGMAAHLAGVIAAHTVKPVIGVPMSSKLNGLDSLLSTVQMPKGVPVATVAVDGAANAALLAVQILATSDHALSRRLDEHKKTMEAEVLEKGKKLAL